MKLFHRFAIALPLVSFAACELPGPAKPSETRPGRPEISRSILVEAAFELALGSLWVTEFKDAPGCASHALRLAVEPGYRLPAACIDNDRNDGAQISTFHKATRPVVQDGQRVWKRVGEGPNNQGRWCASFIQWLVAGVETRFEGYESALPVTRFAVQLYESAPACIRRPASDVPEPGWVAIWRYDAKPESGHTELVVRGYRDDAGLVRVDLVGGNTTGRIEGFDGDASTAGMALPQGVRAKRGLDPRRFGGGTLIGYVDPFARLEECTSQNGSVPR